MTDQDIENEIQEKGLTAKRVTLEIINKAIHGDFYIQPVVAYDRHD
jgi:hypothetical protein